jgi:formate hydrogenlyase transcriptional activator
LIAATNENLALKVDEKRFRSDLYYRLNVFPILVPPLRERREDIPMLVHHFVQKYAGRMNKRIDTIPVTGMQALSDYPWPGNVRELENFIERSVILSDGSRLELSLAELGQEKISSSLISENAPNVLKDVEREHILRTLKDTKWRIGGSEGAAARLGMKRTTLQSLVKRLGIARPT